MKKINIIYLLLLVFCWGCDDFLEESSQNLVKPSNVDDLEQILFGDGYGDAKGGIPYETSIFTDEVSCGVRNMQAYEQTDERKNRYKEQKAMYEFSASMFLKENFGYKEAFWGTLYRRILGCNIVLDYLEGIMQTAATEEEITKGNAIRGEALALRAWCYLHLVNMYGIAYNQGNPKTDLAVPIRTTCQFDFEIPRNTVAEVYELMEKDLLTAIDLLEKNPIVTTTFRIQAPAAKAILARIYLYQERWDDAIKYSKEALAKKSSLLHFGQLNIPEREPGPGRCWEHWSWDCYQLAWQIDTWRIYGDNYYRTESLWVRQAPSNTVETSYIGNAFGPYCMSKEVIANYGEKTGSEDYHKKEGGDLRGLLFFTWYNVPATHVLKDEEQIDINKGSYKYDKHQGIRTAELYLNLAEAYAQKYANGGTTTDRDAVIENLNTLRQHRFTEAAWEELGKVEAADFASAQELLEFCVAERWRELCGETNHRYCDLRRYGMTVKHEDHLSGGTYTQNMAQFVLPIPQAVLESDLSLKDNY